MTDDELNEAVAREVMGWRYEWMPGLQQHRPIVGTQVCAAWFPATDIACSFEVAERMRKRGLSFSINCGAICSTEPERWWASFRDALGRQGCWEGHAVANTAPRAICEAALQAARSKA